MARLAYLVLAALALVNGGCLVVAAGAAAGGAAAVGYAVWKGRMYRDYAASLPNTQAAVVAALADLQFPVVNQSAADGETYVESQLADKTKVKIYLDPLPSRVPADGPVTRVSIRVGTFGDEDLTRRLLDQVGSHVFPAAQTGPLRPVPASSSPPPPAETAPPPVAVPAKQS
jgi:hypothetical protein